jgi:hypothetical protein
MEVTMTELSLRAQALIREAGSADDPSDADRARIREKLIAQLGTGALVSSAVIVASSASGASSVGAASAAATAKGASAVASQTAALGATGATLAVKGGGLSVAAKVAMATVLASTISVGATVAVRNATRSPVETSVQPAALVEPAIVSPRKGEAAADLDRVNGDGIVNVITAPSVPQPDWRSFERSRAVGSGNSAAKTPVKSQPTLNEELDLVRAAQVAMRQGETSAALTMLEGHANRYPNGALREEREAARAIALCELGRLDQGRQVGRRLLLNSPRSPLAGRIHKSCEPVGR